MYPMLQVLSCIRAQTFEREMLDLSKGDIGRFSLVNWLRLCKGCQLGLNKEFATNNLFWGLFSHFFLFANLASELLPAPVRDTCVTCFAVLSFEAVLANQFEKIFHGMTGCHQKKKKIIMKSAFP